MDFNDKVYKLCKLIPKGRVSTYKELAKALDSKGYRAVGNALNKNPYAPVVPCHRVVSSSIYMVFHGLEAKGRSLNLKSVR